MSPLFISWLDSPLPFLFLCSKSDHPKAEDFTFTPFSSFLSLAKRDSIFFKKNLENIRPQLALNDSLQQKT